MYVWSLVHSTSYLQTLQRQRDERGVVFSLSVVIEVTNNHNHKSDGWSITNTRLLVDPAGGNQFSSSVPFSVELITTQSGNGRCGGVGSEEEHLAARVAHSHLTEVEISDIQRCFEVSAPFLQNSDLGC